MFKRNLKSMSIAPRIYYPCFPLFLFFRVAFIFSKAHTVAAFQNSTKKGIKRERMANKLESLRYARVFKLYVFIKC